MEPPKGRSGKAKEMNKAIYDAKRERDILDKVTRCWSDLDLYAHAVFRSII